jgi:phage shock protein E
MNFKNIVYAGLLALITQISVADTVWLDVRSDSEYKMEHMSSSVHLPHSDISKQAETLLPNKDDEILVYCRSGNRAGKAEVALKKLGYTNVTNVGGLGDAKTLKKSKYDQ